MKKQIKKIVLRAIFFCLIILGFNCSSDEKRIFKEARSENTVSVYENFLIAYPESQYRDSVNFLIEKIFFTEGKNLNSINSYIDFLNRYPNNNFTIEAEELLGKKGKIIELYLKKLIPIEGLSEGNIDSCWLEYRGLIESESKAEAPKSDFIIWYKREGFNSEAIKLVSQKNNGKVGQVLGGAWGQDLVRAGQTIGGSSVDVYGRVTRWKTPIETVYIIVKYAIISSNDSQAKVLLLPESKIVMKEQ